MSVKYGKLRKNQNDSSTSNLLSPAQMDRSSSSSSIWLHVDSERSSEADMPTHRENIEHSSSSSHIKVQTPGPLKKNALYSHPKPCYLTIPDKNDAPDELKPNRCDTSLLQQYEEACNLLHTQEVNAMPVKKHRHYYANLPKCHLAILDADQDKPRSKSLTRNEIDQLPPINPKSLRRTLSRPQYLATAIKIPDTWSMAANRVGRLNTKLLDAIDCHNTVEVESMLQAGANPNATCRAGHVSACHAAAFANSDALHLLLKFNADMNRRDKFGRTPLHLAAWAGRNWTIAMLLDFPSDLQYRVVLKVTPETECEIKRLRPHLTSLIDVQCELPIVSVLPQNWKDSIEHKCRKYMTLIPKFFPGWTALHIASYAARHDATRLLLAAGANPNSRDAMGQTPLDVTGAACYLELSKVHVDEYVKTIKTLIDFGGKLNMSDTSSNSALHTAVELGSVDAIQFLLGAGAPIWQQNDKGDTPLHKCVEKFYQEPLQILANYNRTMQTYRPVDVKNSAGYTVLHAAILAAWIPGVCTALYAGGDVTLEAHDGKTAIHIAALEGNLDILDEILLNAAQYENAVNYDNGRTEPPIFCAIRSGNLECVQALIDAGALLKMSYYVEPKLGDTTMEPYLLSTESSELKTLNMILHATAEAGSVNMLDLLFDHEKDLELLLFYKCPYLEKMIPVEFAAYHNRFDTFKFLLQKTLEKKQNLHEIFKHSRLLYIIATENHEDLFNELMRQIPNAVRTANGYYPLHDAARKSNRNLIVQLIQNGADLSETDGYGVTAISLVIDNLSKSTEFLATILDNYIIYTTNTTKNTDCAITVDYRVLIPTAVDELENKGQMRVLTALLKSKNRPNQRKLLAHPVVESFLHLKWKTLSNYFYLMVFLYCLFVLSLSAYTVSVFYYKDKFNETATEHTTFQKIWSPNIWQYIIYVTLGIVVIQELSCTDLLSKSWARRIFLIEFWVKTLAYGLTIITSQAVYMEYEVESGQIDWQRYLATVTLVMAWLNIMMLLSKTPLSGYYIQMFWVVSTKILKIIITFLFIIFMFAFCFMIQFHSKEPFEGPWAAIVKTLVMMTSEFDYSDTFTRKKAESLSTPVQILRIVFVVFLILTAIVLMNLMIGVAVHDVQNLVQDGNLKRLDKQVGFLNRLEVSRGKKSFFHYLGLYRWFKCRKVPQSVIIKAVNDDKCDFSSNIKESITNKAQEQLNKIEKEAESNKIELKLERLAQAIKDIELNVLHHISDLKTNLDQIKDAPIMDYDKQRSLTIS